MESHIEIIIKIIKMNQKGNFGIERYNNEKKQKNAGGAQQQT